ncbi:MAG TPA: RNA chaperone Hfq [Alphaproteobacteria bacterium]|nr:RNA chaperone Hfq [Alphaproteobacteria bacterium]
MTTKNNPVHDAFFAEVLNSREEVTIFLVNGVKLQGYLSWYDNESLMLTRDGITQLVYVHAISTVMPTVALDLPSVLPDNIGNK